MAINGAAAAVATFTIGQTMAGYYNLLPPLTKLRASEWTEENKQVLRTAEVGATIIAFAIAGMTTWLSGTNVPIYVTGIMALTIVCIYEYTLRKV